MTTTSNEWLLSLPVNLHSHFSNDGPLSPNSNIIVKTTFIQEGHFSLTVTPEISQNGREIEALLGPRR